MKFLKTYRAGIKDLPFALLLVDCIWWILTLFNIYQGDYWFVLEIMSHSLAFVFFMSFYAYVHKYCLYSWACIAGLGLLNVLNILHYFVNFTYIQAYAGFIILTALIFAIIRWKKLYYNKS